MGEGWKLSKLKIAMHSKQASWHYEFLITSNNVIYFVNKVYSSKGLSINIKLLHPYQFGDNLFSNEQPFRYFEHILVAFGKYHLTD